MKNSIFVIIAFLSASVFGQEDNMKDGQTTCCPCIIPEILPAAVYLDGKLGADLNKINPSDIEYFGILGTKDTMLINNKLFKGVVYVKTKDKSESASEQKSNSIEKSVSEKLGRKVSWIMTGWPSLSTAAVFLNGNLLSNRIDIDSADVKSFGFLGAQDTIVINSTLYKGILYVKTKEKSEIVSEQESNAKDKSDINSEKNIEKSKEFWVRGTNLSMN